MGEQLMDLFIFFTKPGQPPVVMTTLFLPSSLKMHGVMSNQLLNGEVNQRVKPRLKMGLSVTGH